MATKKKKTATKKTATKKAAKKVAKKATTKKVAKKATTKKTATKKAAKKVAKKATKKTATKKAAKKVAKKATTKKTATKKATKKVAKKATKKTAAKKATKKTATKKAAKKVAKKATKKTTSLAADVAAVMQHAAVKLPARAMKVPASYEASATLIPDGDDALEGAMGEAFDNVFMQDPVPLPAAKATTKPATKKAPKPFVPGDPSEDLAQICAHIALDKKAEDVVILKVADLTSYADYFVIAAATSDRQAQAVSRAISDELRTRGRQPLSTDGMEQGNWVVLDYGSVVVHVFMQTARAYYDLDGFWSDAPRVEVDEDRGQGALQALGA